MSAPFHSPAAAARALVDHAAPMLSRRSGQFIGGLLFDRDPEPLTERQHRWLTDLLRKHGLPDLADGGEA